MVPSPPRPPGDASAPPEPSGTGPGVPETLSHVVGEGARARSRMVDVSAKAATARTALARVEMTGADFARAWEHLDRALALDPLSLQVHWNRLCLARSHFEHQGPGDPGARDRLESACAAMASIDPGWSDDGASSPFLLSLK